MDLTNEPETALDFICFQIHPINQLPNCGYDWYVTSWSLCLVPTLLIYYTMAAPAKTAEVKTDAAAAPAAAIDLQTVYMDFCRFGNKVYSSLHSPTHLLTHPGSPWFAQTVLVDVLLHRPILVKWIVPHSQSSVKKQS
jgi:hypothetical protein